MAKLKKKYKKKYKKKPELKLKTKEVYIPAKLQEMWVHGSSAEMEREGYFISKQRAANGAIFKTHGKEWFHFAIPTPVYLGGQHLSVKQVYVLYKTEGTTKITELRVCDGGSEIGSFLGLGLSGDHSQSVDQENSWLVAGSPEVKYGLGISIRVDFGPPTQLGVPTIIFTTAGAGFGTP